MQTLDDLHARLIPFRRAQTGDPDARVSGVEVMPGHAGFSYGFTVDHAAEGGPRSESFVLRLPPPNVKLEGTADVLRQVRVLSAVRGSDVPVVGVRWSGDDPRWFDRPYFIVPRLSGYTLRTTPGEWGAALSAETLGFMARQAIEALAALHRIDWLQAIPEWAPPLEPEADVQRWDRFAERAADPRLGGVADVVEVEEQERAAIGRTQRLLGAGQAVGAQPAEVDALARSLTSAMRWGTSHRDKVIAAAQAAIARPENFYLDYYRTLTFDFDREAWHGLETFYALAAKHGLLSGAPALKVFEKDIARV